MINNREKVRQDGQRLIDEQEHGQFKETKEFHMKKKMHQGQNGAEIILKRNGKVRPWKVFCFVLNRFYF